MTKKILDEIYKILPKDKVLLNEPMKNHTSMKVGGPAEIFIKAASEYEVEYVTRIANENNIPLCIVGNGSNLLVKDEGIKGIVLKIQINKIEINRKVSYVEVKVGSGVALGALAYTLIQEEITGFEELSGIPGTIGGAIRMNAGAHGKEMKDIVIDTKVLDMRGNTHIISNKEHEFEYRSSIFSKEKYIILETTLKLKSGNREKIKKNIEEYLVWRKEKQPIDYPNAGSTFKRGKNFITAALIDECGLKGYTIGGAQVSNKHAGFIINIGDATAKDVLELIEYVKTEVYKKTGKIIELEIEVI